MAVTLDNAQELMTAWAAWVGRGHGCVEWQILPAYCATPGRPEVDGAPMRRMRDSTREAQIIAYRSALQGDSAFIDGRLHVPSRGPAWVITNHVEPHVRLVEELGQAESHRQPRDWVFPYDRLMEAEAMLAACLLNGRIGHGRQAGRTRGVLTSGTDSMLRIDPCVEIAHAARAMLSTSARALATMPPAAIHAFADVKSILEGGIDPDSARFALMAVAELHAAWLGHQGATGVTDPIDPVGPVLTRLAGRQARGRGLIWNAGLDTKRKSVVIGIPSCRRH